MRSQQRRSAAPGRSRGPQWRMRHSVLPATWLRQVGGHTPYFHRHDSRCRPLRSLTAQLQGPPKADPQHATYSTNHKKINRTRAQDTQTPMRLLHRPLVRPCHASAVSAVPRHRTAHPSRHAPFHLTRHKSAGQRQRRHAALQGEEGASSTLHCEACAHACLTTDKGDGAHAGRYAASHASCAAAAGVPSAATALASCILVSRSAILSARRSTPM